MIKIDMEMPKNCMYCRFCFAIKDQVFYYWCTAGENEVNGKRKRDKKCPLQEIKE